MMDYVAELLEKIDLQGKEMAKVIKGERKIANGSGEDCSKEWLYAQALKLAKMRTIYNQLKGLQDYY